MRYGFATGFSSLVGSKGDGRMVERDDLIGPLQPCDSMILSDSSDGFFLWYSFFFFFFNKGLHSAPTSLLLCKCLHEGINCGECFSLSASGEKSFL